MDYKEYLQSEKWLGKKEIIFSFYNEQCAIELDDETLLYRCKLLLETQSDGSEEYENRFKAEIKRLEEKIASDKKRLEQLK